MNDIGKHHDGIKNLWAVLVEKGYQCLLEMMCEIQFPYVPRRAEFYPLGMSPSAKRSLPIASLPKTILDIFAGCRLFCSQNRDVMRQFIMTSFHLHINV